MADFTIKKGDRLPSIRMRLVDAAAAADVSGGTVAFAMKLQSGTLIVTGAAVIEANTPAVVRYDWGVSDSAVVGVYNAEVIVTKAGKDQTYPNGGYFTVEVVQDVS